MIITRSEEIEQFILETIQGKLGDNVRKGIHVSDLLNPKQAYWQKTKPMIPSKKEIIYWLSGKAHESVFLNVSNFQRGKAKEWNGVWYTPDAYLNVFDNELLTEMKTSRRGFLVKEGEEAEKYEHYLKQLGFYCAIEDKTRGGLFIWYLVLMDENRRNTDPDYFFYEVEYTKEELNQYRNDIITLRDMLNIALHNNNSLNLPDCTDWICYKEQSFMIKKPYCITCKDRQFENDWGIKRHIDSKTGKGHEVVYAKFDKIIEPRCKYVAHCKPEMYQNWLVWKEKNRGTDDFGMEE